MTTPVAEGLFSVAARPRLIASLCGACENVDFPSRHECSRCRSASVSVHQLPRTGLLWTWTVQSFRPPSPPYAGPAEFAPYGVGYVDLDGWCVESLLELPADRPLSIGEPMELVIRELDLGGPDVETTYAFRVPGASA